MSAGFPAASEIPADTRPTALLRSGVGRGALLVFLPVFAAGQAIAWLTYAVSGWYRPWSWFKIGLAETLASVRVTFTARSPGGPARIGPASQTGSVLEVAIGALAIAVVVLAFRAGREQARGLEERPLAAAIVGAGPSAGFAVPMALIAPFVTLGFPQFGIDHLRPVWWEALVLPLVVSAACGAIGGLSAAHSALEAWGRWGSRSVGAARGGFTGFWWGLALAFAGFLVLAVSEPGATGAYARFVDRSGGSGAALVVQHALLVPNQSTTILATSMGVPTTLDVGATTVARLNLSGIHMEGNIGAGLASLVGAPSTTAGFPVWYLAFLAIPVAASLIGGRTAGRAAGGRPEAALRGALAGAVYAVLCGVASWAAAVVLPPWSAILGGSLRLGVDPASTTLVALLWGVVGGTIGSTVMERDSARRGALMRSSR
ncbi:MAG: hypothetical protein E6G54_01490 [Actinobacteria bacterium]|nr:MAG: hypothetical protein E6G54_01490 [Actinomycetota bacterium]